MRKFRFLGIIISFYMCVCMWGQRAVCFHNEGVDTLKITQWLSELAGKRFASTGDMVAEAGKLMLGTPYAGGTLDEGDQECLTVNLDSVDCTTFLESAVAMALCVDSRRISWHDFVYNLERIRYRGGHENGYASRLHYMCDWILDNSHRGVISDVTARIGRGDYIVKTIDFMSRHRDKYPRLKDDSEFERVKDVEVGFRSHRFPFLKLENIRGAKLRSGDLVFFTTTIGGLDVQHVGIVIVENGKQRLLHASSRGKRVMVEDGEVADYVKRNKSVSGIRVVRLMD